MLQQIKYKDSSHNGKMYYPTIARMLSVDNYVQLPNNAQSYNRYSYVLNNPLKYTDPSGEFIGALFFAGAFLVDFASLKMNGYSNAGNLANSVSRIGVDSPCIDNENN